MVAIRHRDADKFVAARPAHVTWCLVFGTDAGLVSERSAQLVRGAVDSVSDPFQVVRMDGDEISADPGKLADEANTIGLFGGRRAVRVELGSKSLKSALEPLLVNALDSCCVVIEGGALRRDHELRRLFEAGRYSAAVECYPDDAQALRSLVAAEFAESGASVPRDAMDALIVHLGADRLTTRSEIEKLKLYARGASTVSIEDVAAVVADASALANDSIVIEAFSGDLPSVVGLLRRYLGVQVEPVVLLGQMLRMALVFHRTGGSGQNLERNARSVGIFTNTDVLTGLSRKWDDVRSARAVEALADALRKTRHDAGLSSAICERAVWSVARLVQSRAK